MGTAGFEDVIRVSEPTAMHAALLIYRVLQGAREKGWKTGAANVSKHWLAEFQIARQSAKTSVRFDLSATAAHVPPMELTIACLAAPDWTTEQAEFVRNKLTTSKSPIVDEPDTGWKLILKGLWGAASVALFIAWIAFPDLPYKIPGLNWNLPITLGQTRHEVHKELGIPDTKEHLSGGAGENIMEFFKAAGFALVFDADHLRSIMLAVNGADEWKRYSGRIVDGVRLTDGKGEVIAKMGPPTKYERAQQNGYVWERDGYSVTIYFTETPVIPAKKKGVAEEGITSVTISATPKRAK